MLIDFFVIEKDNGLVKELDDKFSNQIKIINEDVLKIDETKLFSEKVIVFGNLPYNISTEILSKWIINLKSDFWFECLILMFQKEVADRIIAKTNSSNYGRFSILANWKFNIEKVIDIKPISFLPKPKVLSSLLIFNPKPPLINFNNPENLEYVTKVFFNQRRKKIKKPLNKLFNNSENIAKKLKLNLDLRPQNLDFRTYYMLAEELEKLRS